VTFYVFFCFVAYVFLNNGATVSACHMHALIFCCRVLLSFIVFIIVSLNVINGDGDGDGESTTKEYSVDTVTRR